MKENQNYVPEQFTFIGNTIKSKRENKGLKAKWVAEKAGISITHFSNIEKSKCVPTLKLLYRIARALEIPVSVLLFESLDEKYIEDQNKRELLKELKPLFNDISNILYSK